MSFLICIVMFAINLALYLEFGFWWNLVATIFIGAGTVVFTALSLNDGVLR